MTTLQKNCLKIYFDLKAVFFNRMEAICIKAKFGSVLHHHQDGNKKGGA